MLRGSSRIPSLSRLENAAIHVSIGLNAKSHEIEQEKKNKTLEKMQMIAKVREVEECALRYGKVLRLRLSAKFLEYRTLVSISFG